MTSISEEAAAPRASGVRVKALAWLLVGSATLATLAAAPAAQAQGRPHVLWSEAGHSSAVTAVELSGDGTLLATSSDDSTLKLWRYPAGELLRTIVLPYDIRSQVSGIPMARLTPDGTGIVAAMNRYDGNSDYSTVDLFRLADGSLVREFGRQNGEIASVDISPDGKSVASALQSGAVDIWRLADGRRLRSLAPHPGPVTDVHYSPKGDRLVAAFGDFHLVSWKTKDWSVQWDILAHDKAIQRIAYSSDGTHVATASTDGTARLFDAADGMLLHTLPEGHGNAVFAAAFSPDGATLATGGGGPAIQLWNVAKGTLVRQFADSGGATDSLRFTGDGQVVISGGDFPSRIQEWNPADGTRVRSLTRLSSQIHGVAFSPDSRSVAIASDFDHRVEVLRARDGRRLYSWSTHDRALDVAWSPDGRLLAMPGPGNSVVVRRFSDGKEIRRLVGHEEEVTGVAFSHDGTLLASGSFFPGSIRLWRTSDWSLVRVIQGGSDLGAFGPFVSLAFSPDDQLLGTSAEAVPLVVRVSDGSVVAFPDGLANAVAFSPDGQLFAISGGIEGIDVRIFGVSDWSLVKSLPMGGSDIAFAADGKSLLVAHSDGLRVWRTSDWTVIKAYDEELGYFGSGQGVCAVAVSPDESRMAYGRFDATVVTARYPAGP